MFQKFSMAGLFGDDPAFPLPVSRHGLVTIGSPCEDNRNRAPPPRFESFSCIQRQGLTTWYTMASVGRRKYLSNFWDGQPGYDKMFSLWDTLSLSWQAPVL